MKAELCTLFLFLSMFISMGLSSPTGESLSSPKLEGKIIYTIEFDEIFVIQSGIAYELVSDDHFLFIFANL